MISSRLATYRELQEYYNLQEMYDLLEVRAVDTYNKWLANKPEH